MYKAKNTIEKLNGLVGKRVHFVSDCSVFPINVKGKILSITNGKEETIIKFRVVPQNKIISIGTNMSNLLWELI